MLERIRENIANLMQKKISKDDLLTQLEISMLEMENYILKMAHLSYMKQDAEMAEDSIYLIFLYDRTMEKYGEILNKLILCDWHTQHENIAMLLQKLKLNTSVNALYETANKKYTYLNYDDSYALAVKCIWALGAIGTKEAYHSLKELSKSDNKIIAENAKNQLKRLEEKGLLK